GGVFRRAITIDDLATWQGGADARHMRRRQYVAASQQTPQRRQRLNPVIDKGVKQTGGKPGDRDLMTDNAVEDLIQRRSRLRNDNKPGAIEQRPPDLKGAC